MRRKTGNCARAAVGYQRVLLDQLEALTDPKANQQFKRRQTFWRKNFGTDQWWQPGQAAPSRAPNANVLR
jgi:hypothetical protein